MNEPIQEFERLLTLLKQEKEEDFEQYRRKMAQMPLEQRRKEGYAWFPLQVVQKGYAIGERAFVVVQRTASKGMEHQFRAGKTVVLSSLAAGAKHPERSGVVYYVDKDHMRIILNARDIPEWIDTGQLAVEISFDERTYQEMEKAVHKVMTAQKGRLAELRSVFLGKKLPEHSPLTGEVEIPVLNPSQVAAVRHILSARDVAVVHGPPGTGKTTTLVQAIRLLAGTEQTILVAAPSNTAVDLLTERLAAEGLDVVRVGNISRVDENLVNHTLDALVANHPESKNIRKVKIQAAELRRQANRYRRSYGAEERMEKQRLFQEANELSAWANQLEERLIDQILDSAQVIACTLVGAAHPVLEGRKFRTVVIDEAAQALEPATWIPIAKASRVVLAGDPFQLPPTVKSVEAQRGGFHITLMEKCLNRLPEVALLQVQYRMNEVIMGFSNRQFYQNQLQAAEEVRNRWLPIPSNFPLVFIDTAGCGFEEKVHPAYQSRSNPDEFRIVREHLYLLEDAFVEKEYPSVAVISPYREQALLIRQTLDEDPLLSTRPIAVNTIDGFQGQEKDIVYISLVRSNAKGDIGFLQDYRRMNVAMTRARKQLILVGDSATIGRNPFYLAFLEYCEEVGGYHTAWEYML
ncbi:MAG: AAA family ATPase [Haliscomenobacter sp.]|nr:AAA family ATPase [Haliscomenobacter sp.]